MPEAKAKTEIDWKEKAAGRYYLELARLSTGLLVGVLALMTFLLTVGLQHPQKPFAAVFYTTISLLIANLVLFVIGRNVGLMAQSKEGDSKLLWWVRLVQQVVFVLSVLAVLWLMIVASHIFFATPTQPGPTG